MEEVLLASFAKNAHMLPARIALGARIANPSPLEYPLVLLVIIFVFVLGLAGLTVIHLHPGVVLICFGFGLLPDVVLRRLRAFSGSSVLPR